MRCKSNVKKDGDLKYLYRKVELFLENNNILYYLLP